MKLQEFDYSNMTIRSTRSRYPITSEQINDSFDEIYNNIVDILGYMDGEGLVAVSGDLRESWGTLGTSMDDAFGTSASGVGEAFVGASGTQDYSTINNKYNKCWALIRNP